MLGARIDRYTLEEVLSVGAHTTVYLARGDDGETVVVRMLHPILEHDALARAAVLREAWMGSQLFHPARVRTMTAGHYDRGVLYLVQEYVAGVPLDVLLLRDGPLPLDTAIRALCTVLDVMMSCHTRGFAHGQVTASKIIVEPTGGVRVLDCGGAQTTAPMVLEARVARDLFSCGLLLATLLSGEPQSSVPDDTWLRNLVANVSRDGAESLAAVRLAEYFERTLLARPSVLLDADQACAHLESIVELRMLEGAFFRDEWPAPTEVVPTNSGIVLRNDPNWSELFDDERVAK
jgi:serine/threonine protein kinase